jgi:hypothetical protein
MSNKRGREIRATTPAVTTATEAKEKEKKKAKVSSRPSAATLTGAPPIVWSPIIVPPVLDARVSSNHLIIGNDKNNDEECHSSAVSMAAMIQFRLAVRQTAPNSNVTINSSFPVLTLPSACSWTQLAVLISKATAIPIDRLVCSYI